MRTIFQYEAMLDRATKPTGTVDESKTLAAWQRRAVAVREALLQVKREHEAELADLRETYSEKAFEQKRQDTDDTYMKVREYAVQKVVDDLETTLEGKRAQFDKACSAPTDEHLRLLSVLSMRTTLTPAEIAAVSGKFGGNVQALRALRDIAARHDVYFPDLGDPDEFETRMERARQYAEDRLAEIDTEDADLGYRGTAFWRYPGQSEDRYFFGSLDGEAFTAEQIEQGTRTAQQTETSTTSTTTATQTAEGQPEMWAQIKCNGSEDLGVIAAQFHLTEGEIRKANPNKDLSRIFAGDEILVPGTRFTFQPGSGHVQPEQVKAVPRPVIPDPVGPNGEAVGEDVSVIPE